jgi:hypothetical protein
MHPLAVRRGRCQCSLAAARWRCACRPIAMRLVYSVAATSASCHACPPAPLGWLTRPAPQYPCGPYQSCLSSHA